LDEHPKVLRGQEFGNVCPVPELTRHQEGKKDKNISRNRLFSVKTPLYLSEFNWLQFHFLTYVALLH
jgi:hypothetical protein